MPRDKSPLEAAEMLICRQLRVKRGRGVTVAQHLCKVFGAGSNPAVSILFRCRCALALVGASRDRSGAPGVTTGQRVMGKPLSLVRLAGLQRVRKQKSGRWTHQQGESVEKGLAPTSCKQVVTFCTQRTPGGVTNQGIQGQRPVQNADHIRRVAQR